MLKKSKSIIDIFSEYSIPLIAGVFVSLFVANLFPHAYHEIVHHKFIPTAYWSTLHFFINDIFMVFFFGIAAKEITESFLKGGSLNPIKKAINPLFATIGGVVGPVGVFFLLTHLMGLTHLNHGWGIPTATDIALAWLAAKVIFGASHPAINFLLLLAIVDDAIGLGIIAIFYGDPNHPANPIQLLLVFLGMGIAYFLRKKKVNSWPVYVLIPGLLSWLGLYTAHLHPALALVFIVPFMPSDVPENNQSSDHALQSSDNNLETTEHHGHSTLENFEHSLKLFVDFGLFFFAFANAGVEFSSVSGITWVILAALLIGKTVGIVSLSWIGKLLGFPLPTGMGIKEVVVTGVIAGIGLTVALFVAGVAYTGEIFGPFQGPAKMGALLSGLGFLIAWLLAKALKVKQIN